MELYHLGKHCEVPSCHQLDYLPFRCTHCQHTYCAEHAKPASHGPLMPEHKSTSEPGCPGMLLGLRPGRELAPGVTVAPSAQPAPAASAPSPSTTRGCPHPKCRTKSATRGKPLLVKCNGCQTSYCIPHRLPEIHACSSAASNVPARMRTGGPAGQAALDRMKRSAEQRAH
ncbi:hypothetical protein H9P43_001557 [Blastocladiella emersonii ATCC 22665]|nr:hypothetical protein H9P43_001557 [Blastocladiella emersonii ATCC 22665]